MSTSRLFGKNSKFLTFFRVVGLKTFPGPLFFNKPEAVVGSPEPRKTTLQDYFTVCFGRNQNRAGLRNKTGKNLKFLAPAEIALARHQDLIFIRREILDKNSGLQKIRPAL